MKESITKFDLEAAFKALDDIEVPIAEKGIKANKPALTEIFSRKSKFDALMEEYYDVSNTNDLSNAQEAREAEIAKAKLARIEKIVDLDADSPEDLLTSYVGKFIIQCPQCMTLFYKNPEDVEDSEDDSTVVNVNEVCQHCGNETGYHLIGKVGEATPEEMDDFEVPETEAPEVEAEATEENTDEESSEETLDALDIEDEDEFDLDELNLEDETEEDSDKKEESIFTKHEGDALVEELKEEADLDVSADEFEKLIKSPEFQKPISDNSVRVMMDEFNEEEKEEVTESIKVNNEAFKYAVINPDGTYAGAPCTSEEEARELANAREGRIIVKLESLEEGIFDVFKKKKKDEDEPEQSATSSAKIPQEKAFVVLNYANGKYNYADGPFNDKPTAERIAKRLNTQNKDLEHEVQPYNQAKKLVGRHMNYYKNLAKNEKLAVDSKTKASIELEEGIFDSKEKKQKGYTELVKKTFGQDINLVVNETITNAANLISEVADRFNDDGSNSKTLAVGIIKQINGAKQTINKTPHSLVKSIISIGQKYERDSVNLEELVVFIGKVSKLQNASKDGYKAMEFLFSKINNNLVKRLDQTINILKREFGIVESLDETNDEGTTELEEGIFDKIKDKFADTVDKVASKLKSREAKADWIRENALEDYNNVKANAEGELIPDEKNQRFKTFVVICYTDKYTNGKKITMAPSFNNKDLVIGKNGVQEKKHYKDADNIAKGWSMTQSNGPAFIYLAKDKDDDNAVFLCEYFKGELENDQLEKYFKVVKDHLKGAKLMAKGGMNNDEEETSLDDTDATETTENLNTLMNGLEELQEASLESLISKSLVETYGNVAGFRLKNCSYLNEQFLVDGIIHFTSGNTRAATYTFTEALLEKNGVVKLQGFNEKLGLDNQFTITGHVDKTSNIFITESFVRSKK